MNDCMKAAARELEARARLTFPTGAVLELSGADILGFTVAEGADSPLMPGCVLSAKYTLELRNDENRWSWGGSLRGERPLIQSTAELFVVCDGETLPCGVFIVSDVSAEEHSGKIRLTGCDSVASELTAVFTDTLTYPAALRQLWEHWTAQTRYVWEGTVPNGDAVIDFRPGWDGASLRTAAGWIAQAAGCFVRVSRTGALELVPCRKENAETLTPEEYLKLTDGQASYGPVEALQVTPDGAKEALTFSAGGGTGETVSVRRNPLFVSGAPGLGALAAGMLKQISGLALERAEFRWRGDPALGVGDRVALTDTLGNVHICTITRQTLTFSGGFQADCACEIPSGNDSRLMRAITPEGGVNADALVGTVDGGLLAVGSVTARSVAAAAITSEKLAAGAVSADKIAAGAVTSEKIAAGSVAADRLETVSLTARVAEVLTAYLREVRAHSLTTDELYASLSEIVTLMAENITADTIATDQLAAALGEFVALYADFAGLDFAAVKDLLADEAIFRAGTAGELYIDRLAATSATLVSAVVGELTLKGADGKYYSVTVQSDGTVGTAEVVPTEGEIEAGTTEDGRAIVETSANIAELSAQTIKGASAILSEIFTDALTAGKITAGQAMIASATIPELYTTAIKAIGDSIDISANTTIQLLIATNDLIRAWYTFTEDGMRVGKQGSTYATLTDDTGFHILQLNEIIGSFAKRQLAAESIRVGPVNGLTAGRRVVMRGTSSGGVAFVAEDAT